MANNLLFLGDFVLIKAIRRIFFFFALNTRTHLSTNPIIKAEYQLRQNHFLSQENY